MKKIMFGINYMFYSLCKNLPASSSKIWRCGKRLRAFFGRRIIASAGKKINIEKGATFGRRLKLGNNSGLGLNCKIQGTVTIGDNVMMGPDVLIYTTNHEFKDKDVPMQQQGYQPEKPVNIGNDVWIGARVIILPGVNIGDGCIIGAGAVVTKDVPAYCICAGNPAKVVKER